MNTVDEALKELKLQKMLLENFGIVVSKQANEEDINFVVKRVGTCFVPYDYIAIYVFNYEGWDIGDGKLYVHDTGDCFVTVGLQQHKLHAEVVKQLLLIGYESENPNWIGYKKRVC